jgi:pheromone shutdown protein TraB
LTRLALLNLLLLLLECRGFGVDRPPTSNRVSWQPNGHRSRRIGTQRAASQVLEFIEPTTGVKVQLVGAMHYNPASIQLTADTIRNLAAADQLGSVLIESCDQRWNSTLQLNPTLSSLLNSEMRTAYTLAVEYGRPVVLGDQRINVTLSRLAAGLRETAQDLLSPLSGWPSILGNLTEARQEAVPFGDDYLGLFSFFEAKLMLAAPASFLKYPLSYFVRAPLQTAVFLALVVWVDTSSAATMMDGASSSLEPVSTADLLASLAGSALEIVFFARIFLKELLAERNQVLARNILEECRYYQPQPKWKGWLLNSGSRRPSETIYAEGSVRPRYDSSSEKTVVAVLGMAHCNGIRKLLEEQRV